MNVERDVTVSVEFSEPIDEASVTSESVRLLSSDGAVSGTVNVTRNTITFVPDVPLSLLETYTITLSESIADLAGNTLGSDASAEFRVRDGRWGTPTYPFGTTLARSVTAFQRNAAGDVVIGMTTWPNGSAGVHAAIYEAAQDGWGEAAALPTGMISVGAAVIDGSRRAAVVGCCSGEQYVWARLMGESTWVDAGVLGGVRQQAAYGVTEAGSATAVWSNAGSPMTVIMNLSNGSIAEPLPVYVPGDFFSFFPITSLNRIGLVAAKQFELAVLWKEGTSWSGPQPLASASIQIDWVQTDSDELGNVIVAWSQGNELWARIYERARDQWTQSHRVGATMGTASTLRPDITAGHAIVAANGVSEGTLSGIYRADQGWLESSVTLLDNPGGSGWAALTIDRAGNALAVGSAELKYRRYVAGSGWQDPGSLEADVQSYDLFSAGAPDGSVFVVANDLAANPNRVPMAVRFE